MKRVSTVFFLFIACCLWLHSQTTTVVSGSHIAGNASTAYISEWIPFHTPASLASETGISLQFSLENRYLTKELFNQSVAAGFHTKHLNVGISYAHFGFADYHEMLAGIAFARSFSKRLNIGIQVDYYTVRFPQLQKYKGTVLAQFGIQGEVLRGFYLAFHAFNLTFSKIKSTTLAQKLPAVFSLGTLHVINEQVNWVAQLDKDIYGDWRWAVGAEYAPFKQLSVRLGAYGQEFVPTLGLGLRFGEFRFNLHCEYHLNLGLCTHGMLAYRFK